MKITHPRQLPGVVRSRNISVLSVDLFDTLVYRRCSRPDRVFAMQFAEIREMLPNLLETGEWVKLRKAAELEISEQKSPREVCLHEIYECIADKLSLCQTTVATMAQAELAVEADVIAPFAEFIKVLKELSETGTRIVINTDIYLPAAFIRELLNKVCPFHVELICSSETQRPKRTGGAYSLLKQSFPAEATLHVGDNPHSDYRMARQHGVQACLVEWDRSRWIRSNRRWSDYLASLGSFRIPDMPADLGTAAFDLACGTLGWRWASVLLDYLLSLRRYASRVSADEIWFLSRDCESLFSALSANSEFLEGFAMKYVYTSRAATYPLFAEPHPERFRALTGRTPDNADLHEGQGLGAAYRQYVNEGTRRILVVDAGWKGRVQTALQLALPDIKVYGFYFSLDYLAEPAARAASECFVPWKPAHINQAAVECLFGFRGNSCVGYSQDTAGKWEPRFHQGSKDVAPSSYCASLRFHLADLLAQSKRHHEGAPVEQRLEAVQRVCMFPDELTALAFREWSIGAAIDSGKAANLIRGGSSSWILRLLGIQRDGNLWPAAAAWGISNNVRAVRALQSAIRSRKALTDAIKPRLSQLAKSFRAMKAVHPRSLPQPR